MDQQLVVYNSLAGKKEAFTPLVEGHVGMYVCGPTVYSNVHLGNCRTFISFDIIFRYLKYLGYKVRYVRNITDAGHLENDEDVGEDRISKRARVEQLEPMEVVQRYTVDFHNTLATFNTLPPSIEPTATGHIMEQIELIKTLVDKGMAYEVNGSVYFDVLQYNQHHQYGILSKRNIEDLIHNTRTLDGQSDKKNPQDFALWKKAELQHIMRWPSPWGVGFPGWHLECTAMSTKYLGETFDIHGGGMDLKFPHHECEIAQATAIHQKAPVRYWLHANMLTLNGKKMAKSTGNNILPHELFSGENKLFSKAYSPEVVRFFILQAHYRSIVDISEAALAAAEKGYQRLLEAVTQLATLETAATNAFDFESWQARCHAAMNDDFNTPVLIAHLFDAAKAIKSAHNNQLDIDAATKEKLQQQLEVFIKEVLGLEMKVQNKKQSADDGLATATISLLLELRDQARLKRDFETADQIRDALLALNIQLNDGKDGTTFNIQ